MLAFSECCVACMNDINYTFKYCVCDNIKLILPVRILITESQEIKLKRRMKCASLLEREKSAQ